jgi:hypothetical protein
VVQVLKATWVWRVVELVLLADRLLCHMPELFGRTCSLFDLDILQNSVVSEILIATTDLGN